MGTHLSISCFCVFCKVFICSRTFLCVLNLDCSLGSTSLHNCIWKGAIAIQKKIHLLTLSLIVVTAQSLTSLPPTVSQMFIGVTPIKGDETAAWTSLSHSVTLWSVTQRSEPFHSQGERTLHCRREKSDCGLSSPCSSYWPTRVMKWLNIFKVSPQAAGPQEYRTGNMQGWSLTFLK